MYFRHLMTFLMYRLSLCALLDRKYSINLTLFFRPSILLECKISELAQLNEHKVRKTAKLEFSKWRSWGIKKAQEGSKMPQKWKFSGFDKNLINSDVNLYVWETSDFSYCQKTSRPIRMQDSVNYNISETS